MPEPDLWTNELRAAWREIWATPAMQKGLAVLRDHARLKAAPAVLPPGYDLRDYAAASFNHALGQANLLEKIEEMGREKKPLTELHADEMFRPPKQQ